MTAKPLPPETEVALDNAHKKAVLFSRVLLKRPAPGLRKDFEKIFGVSLNSSPIEEGGTLAISFTGTADKSPAAEEGIRRLFRLFLQGNKITAETVAEVATACGVAVVAEAPVATTTTGKEGKLSNNFAAATSGSNDNVAPQQAAPKGKPGEFQPRTKSQATLAKLIDTNSLVFAIGPAGTGKTHVALAKAIEFFKAKKVKKIVLARPVLEAGENVGFLKGDKNEKLEEYMRPFYDMLDDAFGKDKWRYMMTTGQLDIVAFAHMRGRTQNDAFVIYDEAQNCTRKQLYMGLTRIGEKCYTVVTGDPDPNQIDLPPVDDSGLAWAAEGMANAPSVASHVFTEEDVMRSDMAKTVVSRLGDYFKKNPGPAIKRKI